MQYEESVNLNLPAKFYKICKSEQAPWAVLIHGFAQSGRQFYSSVSTVLENYNVLALDAPWPFVRRVDGEIDMTYSWYFFDKRSNHYLTPLSLAVDYASEIVSKVVPESTVKILIGYSQGGYVVPYLLGRVPGVSKAITINSRWRSEDLQLKGWEGRAYCLNSEEDQLIDAQRAKTCFDEIVRQGVKGQFITVSGGHEINAPVLNELQGLLRI